MTQTKDVDGIAKVEISYRTKDLNQAAFIWCQVGARIAEVQGSSGNGTSIFFKFTLPLTEDQLRALLIAYANGDTRVEPKEFCAKQYNLRDLIHSSLDRRKATLAS